MSILSLRFMRLTDGRLLDTFPMEAGKPPLVSNEDGSFNWVPFRGTFGSLREASFITEDEEKALIGDTDE